MPFQFMPPDGYRNTVTFPQKPANETAFRDQIMSLLDQARDYINNVLPIEIGGGLSRNAFVNPRFKFWQRGTNSSGVDYLADKWRLLRDGSGQVHNVSRQSFTLGQSAVPGNPEFFWRYQVTSAASGQTYNALVHRIEGVKTFAGSKATVSFYAKANTNKQIIVKGTQDFGSGGSPSTRNTFETTSPITLSSNWKKYSYTFTIPAISGKFLGSNSDDYLEVAFWFPNNDTYVIDLAEMVFNIGDAALPLQPREEALELLLCQRTFEKSYDVETPPGSTGTMQGIYNHVGSPSTATGIGILVNFKVPKRSVPIISLYDMIGNVGKLSSWNGGSQSNNLSAAIDQISMNKFRVLATVSSGNYELYGHYTASCDL